MRRSFVILQRWRASIRLPQLAVNDINHLLTLLQGFEHHTFGYSPQYSTNWAIIDIGTVYREFPEFSILLFIIQYLKSRHNLNIPISCWWTRNAQCFSVAVQARPDSGKFRGFRRQLFESPKYQRFLDVFGLIFQRFQTHHLATVNVTKRDAQSDETKVTCSTSAKMQAGNKTWATLCGTWQCGHIGLSSPRTIRPWVAYTGSNATGSWWPPPVSSFASSIIRVWELASVPRGCCRIVPPTPAASESAQVNSGTEVPC